MRHKHLLKMACVCIMSLSVLIIACFWVYRKIKNFFAVPDVPILENTWWGAGDPTNEDTAIKPFEINISEEVLKDLRHRLDIALPFQEPLEDAKQHYGINTNLLKTIVHYWKNEYDWRKQEQFLNQYPQFKVSIQGLKIHYLHVKPKETDGLKVIPLLLLHGWPGSVREFYEIIPILTGQQSGRDFVFEVIAPSLPGFGFSDGAARKGLGSVQMAVIFKNLMEKLGFNKYYIQGGDWGAVIVSYMAVLYPGRVLGVHSNMPYSRNPMAILKIMISTYFPKLFLKDTEDADYFDVKRTLTFWEAENAYGKIQSTKPDTVGVGLRDSPVGLAAYILEKFITWTNRDWKDLDDGGLIKKFSYTILLDNVMIYWVSRCMTTSMRIYREHFSPEHMALGIDKIPIKYVPSGCSRFFYDIVCYPESIIKESHQKLEHITFHRNGGHFAALEVPDVLAKDIYDFTEKVEKLK